MWDLTCVGGELGWYIFFNSVLVCADVDIKMLRVRAACCTVACCVGVQASKRGAVDQPMSCSALMCHVVGADCSPSFKTPQHALPNVREHDTLPTDRALYVPNSGRTPPPAITVAAHFRMERSQVWEVQGSATLLRALSGLPCDGQEHCLQKTRHSCSRTVERLCHDLCTAAKDRVAAALGCAKRVTVFAGLAGQMYT